MKCEHCGATWAPPKFEDGVKVIVDHPRYKGEGIVNGRINQSVGVLLPNGNTWYYEVDTVRLAGTK